MTTRGNKDGNEQPRTARRGWMWSRGRTLFWVRQGKRGKRGPFSVMYVTLNLALVAGVGEERPLWERFSFSELREVLPRLPSSALLGGEELSE